MGGAGSQALAIAPVRFFNAGLAILDGREVPHAHLAERLPELGTDAWRVLSDGRMETTYRLRPNLTWHDGAPFSAADFVFGWRVYTDPNTSGIFLSTTARASPPLAVGSRVRAPAWASGTSTSGSGARAPSPSGRGLG